MKPLVYFVRTLAIVFLCWTIAAAQGGKPQANIYRSSLHATGRGLAHWYSKENGGLERITGIPFMRLGSCNRCHVDSCDTCHVADGKMTYSAEVARSESACDECHNLPTRAAARKTPEDPNLDVHFARGMKCMDCHSSREVHGDGVVYASMQSPGALDANCRNCHKELISKCPSSLVHGDRLDCSACHLRRVNTCFNCHFDTRVKEGKSVSLPLKDALFLVNHDGKVTPGALHTFIYQNRTMIVFAPSFSHDIMKEGRKCDDCHNTPVLHQMKGGKLKLVTWDGKDLKNTPGVIPVLDDYQWNFPFLNYENGRWVTADRAARPLLNYSGYATPITKDQFSKLLKKQYAEEFMPKRPPKRAERGTKQTANSGR